jgi:hypothetical protein
MSSSQLEVADVFEAYGTAYLEANANATSAEQRRVMNDIVNCRTAALGGEVEQCDTCGHTEVLFHSCRNRHCPKCQAAARADWLDARAQDLLPGVDYYHVVFTVPDDKVADVALQNKRVVYRILFRAAAETLLTIARDPKHLGAEIGFLAVLHTWGQQLLHHPHVHCVVAGGGIAPEGERWISCRKDFFLPVRVLSRLFQKKFLAYLDGAYRSAKLSFRGKLDGLDDPEAWKRFLASLYDLDWVVYAKPPFGGPERVLKYLARYTHRVAISNQRLVSLDDGKVTFRWKDYAHGNAQRTMTLDAVEFIRRFLLHTLPVGFVRIRHYGFLANRKRRERLALCRKLLGNADDAMPAAVVVPEELISDAAEKEKSHRCPICKEGRMHFVETLQPALKRSALPHTSMSPCDTT